MRGRQRPGLTRQDEQALRAAGVAKPEDLAEKLVAAGPQALPFLEEKLGTTGGVRRALLDPRVFGIGRRTWGWDLTLAATAVLALCLISALVWDTRQHTQQLVARRDLPPYSRLAATDLQLVRSRTKQKSFARLPQVVGHLTLSPIKAGDVLQEPEVSPHVVSPESAVASITPEGTLLTGLKPGQKVLLLVGQRRIQATLLAQRKAGAAEVLDVVIPLKDASALSKSKAAVMARP